MRRQPKHKAIPMRYSVIIPVYNRPDEVDELLQSLTQQSFKDFEVIVVEDGSSIPCKPVTEKYQELLDVHYYDKPNSGPGQTRNYGVERSKGEYLIILDSDCILPEGYFLAVEEELQHEAADAFGGPDRAARIIHKHTESHQLLHDLLLHHRRLSVGGRRRWTSSIRVASTWVCGRKCTKPWADSRGCASGRTSTSASESSREDIHAGCSPVPGYTTSDGQTSENSSSRYTIPGLPASICTRSIRNR